MRILGVDCGLRNFAVAEVDCDDRPIEAGGTGELKIVSFSLDDIGDRAESWHDSCVRIFRDRKPDRIIIERQLGRNVKVSCAAHVAFAVARSQCAHVTFAASNQKLKLFEELGWTDRSGSYRQRKRSAERAARALLVDYGADGLTHRFDALKKRDDVADAALYAVAEADSLGLFSLPSRKKGVLRINFSIPKRK